MTLNPGWVDQPAPNEEGRRKYDEHGIGARPSGGEGGRDEVFKNRVYLKLRIMEKMVEMTAAACLDNLSYPLEADGREICQR